MIIIQTENTYVISFSYGLLSENMKIFAEKVGGPPLENWMDNSSDSEPMKLKFRSVDAMKFQEFWKNWSGRTTLFSET